MNQRPKLKIALSPTDKRLEFAGILLLILLWALTLINYFRSPQTVPIHYNFSGEADAYGSKLTLLFLPLIPTLLYWGMTILNRHPHLFNYPTAITAQNAERQYRLATRMIRFLKLAVVLIFFMEAINSLLETEGVVKGLAIWFLPLSIVLILAPTAWAIFQSSKRSGKEI